ncbi:MAG: methylenetetrahydrofolate reductase [NAD(P)H] [Pirellulaceae bacterium]|jgi:methylenetetrahydrofolate reductase (NADPH)|nr:methylenetetrahydrofolate reductase [NAD(P)H] [Pirellulaceae bacterium]
MGLAATYGADKFGLSFELYPPRTRAGEQALFRHVRELVACQPDFLTCTYGAGGSTRTKTLDVVSEVRRAFSVPVAAHLTCVDSSVDQLRAYLDAARAAGVDYIVALRGDPPQGQGEFRPPAGGLSHANELVALIRAEYPDFGVAVAGYPETHREAPSPEADVQFLRRKVDAGADVVITQLFYCNDDFFRFRERCEKAGIRVPIVPGILPVNNLAQIQRITTMCGARLPASLVSDLQAQDDAEWQYQVGVEYATRQVRQLVQRGVPGIHFYVLNKSSSTLAVLQAVRQL